MRGKIVLLINPGSNVDDANPSNRIHMGLTLLGSLLTKAGHKAKVVDYIYLQQNYPDPPILEDLIGELKPDVVCITMFSSLYDRCVEVVRRINDCCNAPVIAGGPHVTMFPRNELPVDIGISYFVRGEAEEVILELVENAKKQKLAKIIDGVPCPPEKIPEINLDIAIGAENLFEFQFQLSRGCPFLCTFCNVISVAGRKLRLRNLEKCIKEIKATKDKFPKIGMLTITDDCPTCDKKRFKQFLRMLIEANIDCALSIDNMRADSVDHEMLELLKKANCSSICLGVESGHPVVYANINKGERLESIIEAAQLIKKHGFILGMCFVIGLPGDTLERHKVTMDFAKRMEPNFIHWNMCIPWWGTGARAWYEKNGVIGDIKNVSLNVAETGRVVPPVCESGIFSRNEMISAWLMANMETHAYYNTVSSVFRLFYYSIKYKTAPSFFYFLFFNFPRGFIRRITPGPIKRFAKTKLRRLYLFFSKLLK